MAASGCGNKYARPGLARARPALDTQGTGLKPGSDVGGWAGCSRSPEPRQPRSASRLSGDRECEPSWARRGQRILHPLPNSLSWLEQTSWAAVIQPQCRKAQAVTTSPHLTDHVTKVLRNLRHKVFLLENYFFVCTSTESYKVWSTVEKL